MPLNILRIYYQTLSGASIEELKSSDVVKQTQWLLTELLKEYNNKEDDLVKTGNEESVSILADIDDLLKVQYEEKEKLLKKRREKIAELNTLVNQFYNTKEAIDEIFDKIKEGSNSSDDIIVSESSDKVDNKSEITEENGNKDENIKTRISRNVDELWLCEWNFYFSLYDNVLIFPGVILKMLFIGFIFENERYWNVNMKYARTICYFCSCIFTRRILKYEKISIGTYKVSLHKF